MDLTALGWTAALAEAFAACAREGLVPARVALEHTHIYRVLTEEGEWLARVSGRLRHLADGRVDFPAVGDWVAVERGVQGGDARIRAVLPRFSRFSRRAAGDPTEEQIVAANINTVFIVGGLDGDFNVRRIERYLVVAWESGAVPVVVLNKSDLVEQPEQMVDEITRIAPAVPVYAVSCRAPETLAVLHTHLGFGQTGALLGSSGVGKSTIVNQLIGWVVLPPGGILIDTPGMRELQLWDTGEALAGAFADIEALGEQCRFRDCSHRHEPGCAVRAAAESGDLAPERLASFAKLRDEQAYQARQQDQRALLDQKRQSRIGSKALQKRLKEKGRI
jgi:ribosome biogenesis GTPase